MKWNGYTRLLAVAAACAVVPSIAQSQQQFPPSEQAGQVGTPQGGAEKPVVIATVNGEPITKPEFEQAAQRQVASAQQNAAQQGQQLSPQDVAQVKSSALDSLIESRLIEAYAIEKVEVPEAQVKQTIEQVEQQLAQQQVPLETYVSNQGQTMESFKKRIEGSLAWQGLQQQELRPEKLQQFYQSNQQLFQGESFEAVQPEVAQAYVGTLWEQIVKEMKPKAKIEKKDTASNGIGSGRSPGQPAAGGFPPPGSGR